MDRSDASRLAVENVLAHYGVKGMKWGVRRRRPTGPTHGDAKRAKAVVGRVRTNRSTDVASNKDLRIAIERMNLERQYDSLRPKSASEKTRQWIASTLLGIGKEQAANVARQQATQAVSEALKNAKR